MRPGFSERQFELELYREFCDTFKNDLSKLPFIPNLRQERLLGYDMAFELKARGRPAGVFSFFLQNKVSELITQRRKSNAVHYGFHGAPHYKFRVTHKQKSQQHNILVNLARSEESVFYCAPLFIMRAELERYGREMRILEMSKLFRLSEMTQISDMKPHHVSYNTRGDSALFASDPVVLDWKVGWNRILSEVRYFTIIPQCFSDVLQKANILFNANVRELRFMNLSEHSVDSRGQLEFGFPVYEIAEFLKTHFRLEWIMVFNYDIPTVQS